MKIKQQNSFWTSYSDLMTSLFFVMLVLFIICLIKVGHDKRNLKEKIDQIEEIEAENKKIKKENENLKVENRETKASYEQVRQILHIEEQFNALSQSTSLGYDKEKKMFYAKDFVGIEIFYSNDDKIKKEHLQIVDKVGDDLMKILESLSGENRYQLVIEGYAAIKWDQKRNHSFDPDNKEMYYLSYRRALALYDRWRKVGKHDFRKYNTEIIIAGSGFNGCNRDSENEDNNKRFVIQIIPKINRPENYSRISNQ